MIESIMQMGLTRTAALFAMLLMGSAALAVDPMSRLEIYQTEIKPKQTGVYEIGDALYINVRAKQGPAVQRQRTKMKMSLQAHDELKKWAIAYTAEDRKGCGNASVGISACMSILDSINSDWRFGSWNCKVKGQEIWGKDGDFLILGQIFAKADVVETIPSSFRDPCPTPETVFQYLRIYLPAALQQAPDRLKKDLFETKECVDEMQKLDTQISKYMKTSVFAEKIRHDAEKASAPNFVEIWEERPDGGMPDVRNSVMAVTNVLSTLIMETNIVVRMETDEEVKSFGVSRGGVVRETVIVGDVEEVVETRTVLTTTKRFRRRRTSSVVAEPMFEKFFLSGGKMQNQESVQTEEGRNAAATFTANPDVAENKLNLRVALAHNPGDKELWNLFGRMLQNDGDEFGAIVCYLCALKLDPQYGYALTNFAMVASRLGFKNLGLAYAVFVRGISSDSWCVKNAEKLILDQGEK